MFDPDTQAYDVAVNAEGTATPTRITFDVKTGEYRTDRSGPGGASEAYQVRVDFRNQETGVLFGSKVIPKHIAASQKESTPLPRLAKHRMTPKFYIM